METPAIQPKPMTKWAVLGAAALVFAGGAYLAVDGWLAPEFSAPNARVVYMLVQIVLGAYMMIAALGVGFRYEWARLSAIWLAALFSPIYVARLLIVSDSIVSKVRDFALATDLPHFFLLCLIVITLSAFVVMTLTSVSGRTMFPHVTDRERTDWLGLTCLTVCIALDLLVMINYVVSRHYERYDVSRAAFYNLSEKTISQLRSLRQPVNVIVYFSPQHELYEHVSHLLSEYQRFSSQLKVEFIDPFRSPARSEDVRRTYEIGEENVVIFAAGLGDSMRKKFVETKDLAEYEQDRANPYQMSAPRLRAFTAERAFHSAITAVAAEKQPKAYFLSGHGEHDVDDFDPETGYSTLATYLKRDNIVLSKLSLALQTEIPPDCDLLVIGGPRKPIPPQEINAVRQYLAGGGRAVVLLSAGSDTGLEPLLAEWNVRVNSDVILVWASLMGITQRVVPMAYVESYSSHPIVSSMSGISTQFPYARSLASMNAQRSARPSNPKVRATELGRTTAQFWGETNLEREKSENRLKFDEGADNKGPLAVAVASESVQADGAEDIHGGRVVVIGSSRFVANDAITANNLDMFRNSVNWLLRRQELIGIGPKYPQEFALRMTPRQMFWTQISVVYGLPGLIAFVGVITWFFRRK